MRKTIYIMISAIVLSLFISVYFFSGDASGVGSDDLFNLSNDNNRIDTESVFYKYFPSIVSVKTGRLNLTYNDILISDGFFPLVITRTFFQDKRNIEYDMGKGWNHNFDIRMNFSENNSLIIVEPAVWSIKFTKSDNGAYLNNNNPDDIISKNPKNRRWIRSVNKIPFQEFSRKGYLTKIFAPNGKFLELSYGKDRRLSKITTPNGHYAEILYKKKGFIAEIKTDTDKSVSYSYNDKNELICVQKINGSLKYTYRNGNIETIIYPDMQASKFEYDKQNKVRAQYIGKNQKIKYQYTSNKNSSISNTKIKYPDNSEAVYEYDENNLYITNPLKELSVFKYDSYNRLLEYINPLGASVKYEYDNEGRIVTVTDLLGGKIKKIYNKNNSQPSDVIYPNGLTDSFKYDKFGNITFEANSTGEKINYLYSDFEQLKKIIYQDGSLVSFKYDANGYLTKKSGPGKEGIELTYNNQGLITEMKDSTGDSITYSYTLSGQLITEKRGKEFFKYAYDKIGRVVSITDSTGEQTEYKYNNAGLTSEVIYPSGQKLTYAYDIYGNVAEVNDTAGNTTSFKYDILQRLIEEINPEGFSTKYTYNASGNNTSVTGEMGNTTFFKYNPAGRLVKETDPVFNSTGYLYDTAGNIKNIIYPDKSFVEFSYNINGLLKEKKYSDGICFKYKYDNMGNLTEASQKTSKVSRASAFNIDDLFSDEVTNSQKTDQPEYIGRLMFRYDRDKNLVSKMNTIINKEIKYNYDVFGRLIELLVPDNHKITYTYDSDDNLISITDPDKKVFNLSYTIAGNKSVINYPNGIKQIFYYNNNTGNPEKIILKNKSGSTVRKITYQYDDSGNVVRKSDSEFKPAVYKYDKNDSLVYEKNPNGKTAAYELDKNKNIIRKTLNNSYIAYKYNSNNQLTQAGNSNFEYDSKGNTVRSFSIAEDNKFEYNTDNRMSSVGGGITKDKTEYVYGPTGNRLTKSDNNNKTFYLYDGINVIAEYNDKLIQSCYYIYSSASDNPLMVNSKGTNYYFHQDVQGNIIAVTDEKGSQISIYTYEAYGSPIIKKEDFKSPYLFTGRRYDRNTGLYYYRMRYYDPKTARFLSKDPIFSTNLYLYCNSNPVNYTDPLGLKPVYQEGPLPSGVKNVTIDDAGAGRAGIRAVPSFVKDPSKWPPKSSSGSSAFPRGRLPSAQSHTFPVVNRRMNAADWEYTGQYGNVVRRGEPYVVDIWRNKNTGVQHARFVRGGTTGGLAHAAAHAWSQNQTPTIGAWTQNPTSIVSRVGRAVGGAAGRAANRVRRLAAGAGRGTFASVNPNLVPFYNLSAAGLAAGGGLPGLGIVIAGVGTAGYVGYEIGTALNEFEPVRRGATATMAALMTPQTPGYGSRLSGLNPQVRLVGSSPDIKGGGIRGSGSGVQIQVIPADRRLQIRAVLAKGCHAFNRKQFSQCSVLMDEVKSMIAQDLRTGKKSSSDISFYSDTLNTADDYYNRSLAAMDIVSLYNEAIEYYNNYQYDQCISRASELLSKNLENLNLSELFLQANALRNTALQNQKRKKTIESLYKKAFEQMNFVKLKGAFDTFSRIIDLNPKEVGLSDLESRTNMHLSGLIHIFVTERKVNAELPKAVALFEQDEKNEAKALFLKLKNMINSESHPAYFKNQRAVINEYLSKLDIVETVSGPLLTFGQFVVKPKKVLPGSAVNVSGTVTLENLNALYKISAAYTVSIENVGDDGDFLDNISNGNYPFNYRFKIPENTKPGVYTVTGHLDFLGRNTKYLRLSVSGERADTIIVENKADDDPLADDDRDDPLAEDDRDDPLAGDFQEETETTPEETESKIFGYMEPMFINNRDLWAGDTLSVQVRFNIFGLQKNKTIPVSIKLSSPGLETKAFAANVKNGKHKTTFSYTVPRSLESGNKTVTAVMEFGNKFDSKSETYCFRKPRMTLLSTSAFPVRIKRGGRVKLAAPVSVSGLKQDSSLTVNGTFSGRGLSTVRSTKKIKNKTTTFYATYKFRTNCKEGTYKYTFTAKSSCGTQTLSGTFIVGRSDEEIKAEQERIERERSGSILRGTAREDRVTFTIAINVGKGTFSGTMRGTSHESAIMSRGGGVVRGGDYYGDCTFGGTFKGNRNRGRLDGWFKGTIEGHNINLGLRGELQNGLVGIKVGKKKVIRGYQAISSMMTFRIRVR